MTRRWTLFTIAGFVGELKQGRLPGGSGAFVELEDHFLPDTLLLPSFRDARRPLLFGGGIGPFGM